MKSLDKTPYLAAALLVIIIGLFVAEIDIYEISTHYLNIIQHNIFSKILVRYTTV